MESKTVPVNTSVFIAILPLQVLAQDSRVEMFCEGLVMDLITDLSRFRSFQIIAYDSIKRLSADQMADHPLLRELQLDYILKGMVRPRREELLFNLQLIHVGQNRLVWAEKFSGGFEELFHIQEEVAEKIVTSLQHFVDADLLSEIRKKPITSLSAYECWLKGYQELKKGTLESDERARAYFQQAMELDPHYPRAYTGMSLSYFNEWSCQLWTRWDVSRNGAFEWAQKALELDEWDHVSNAILGRLYVFNEEYEKAEKYLRRSLRINPNDAEMLVLIAFGLTYLGRPEEARELYERARRLNPADHYISHACGAFVHFELGDVERAIALGSHHEIGKGWVDFYAYQAAAFFLKGDLENMKECWQIYVDEFSLKINGGQPADTQTALQWMINVNPYRGETKLKPFWEYMSRTTPDMLAPQKNTARTTRQSLFTEEGGIWQLSFDGVQAQINDLKGLHDIRQLLLRPNQAIHCTELMGVQAVDEGVAVLDEKAKKAYRERILELQAELEEAEALLHSERIVRLQKEYDQLIEHLSRSVGKGGAARKVAGSVEKCRSAVTWRIRSAVKKVAEVHPALAKHLDISIKTGVFCEYTPEYEVDWQC
jgi:TolB-like protein